MRFALKKASAPDQNVTRLLTVKAGTWYPKLVENQPLLIFKSNICGCGGAAAQTVEGEAVMVLCAAPVWRRRMAQVSLT